MYDFSSIKLLYFILIFCSINEVKIFVLPCYKLKNLKKQKTKQLFVIDNYNNQKY